MRENCLNFPKFGKVRPFDILNINTLKGHTAAGHENTRLFGHESAEDIVHKFVFLSDDRNIKEVWVNGQKVKDTAFPQC